MHKSQKDETRRCRDEGFTLIELMVVVLIIGILIAIAIPTFLGARSRAQDRAAQSSLRNAVTAAKAIYTDNEDYAQATVATLGSNEPSLTFRAGNSDSLGLNDVSVDPGVSKSSEFVAAALSASNTCWYVSDSVAPGTHPGTHWQKKLNAAAGQANAGCSAGTLPGPFTSASATTPGGA